MCVILGKSFCLVNLIKLMCDVHGTRSKKNVILKGTVNIQFANSNFRQPLQLINKKNH